MKTQIKKEFNGKNDVKAKSISNSNSNIKKEIKVKQEPVKVSKIKDSSSNDEWESF
ncbi:hypothetical protein [Arcobacter vandammei]|uniref:hypothetical protein n=1 Tax=Arcobacter vandammei TaxID=2782243 RepID=UPI003B848687